MSEQPIFRAKHDVEDIDASTESVHHTLGTFRHQATSGAHNHHGDDPSSLPLLDGFTYALGDLNSIAGLVELLGGKTSGSIWKPTEYNDYKLPHFDYKLKSDGDQTFNGTGDPGVYITDTYVMPPSFSVNTRHLISAQGTFTLSGGASNERNVYMCIGWRDGGSGSWTRMRPYARFEVGTNVSGRVTLNVQGTQVCQANTRNDYRVYAWVDDSALSMNAQSADCFLSVQAYRYWS
jgi:hypothetical protein